MKITELMVADAIRHADARVFTSSHHHLCDIADHLNAALKRQRVELWRDIAGAAFAVLAIGGVITALSGFGAGYLIAVAAFVAAMFCWRV